MKKPAAKSYALRIDAQLVKPLQELKKQNRRSLNAEINAALETWILQARPTDSAHEDLPKLPTKPATASGSKQKRKASQKQSEKRAETPPVTPAAE